MIQKTMIIKDIVSLSIKIVPFCGGFFFFYTKTGIASRNGRSYAWLCMK